MSGWIRIGIGMFLLMRIAKAIFFGWDTDLTDYIWLKIPSCFTMSGYIQKANILQQKERSIT